MLARKVLLVVEGTQLNRESLMCALHLCQRTSAELLVLNVVACPQEHTYWADVHRRLVSERLSEAARRIDPLLDEVRAQGVAVELVRQAGDTEAVLGQLAQDRGGLVAVVASQPPSPARARSAARQACAGPVRRQVARIETLFGCPLVAVKARK